MLLLVLMLHLLPGRSTVTLQLSVMQLESNNTVVLSRLLSCHLLAERLLTAELSEAPLYQIRNIIAVLPGLSLDRAATVFSELLSDLAVDFPPSSEASVFC